MGRTVRDANLETRTARLRLAVRGEPYWRGLETGLALGYRRRRAGGTWLARRRRLDGNYIEARIGIADDFQDADGILVFDYAQAQRATRAWWETEQRREQGHEEVRSGPFTVSDAVTEYLDAYARRGGKAVYHARRAAELHILPGLGSLEVAKLTTKKIEEWHHGLVEKWPRARSRPDGKPNFRRRDTSSDGLRKRRATANRILTVLKAALNHAWKSGHVASDNAWRRVRPFKGVAVARIRYLNTDECVRLVNASEERFRDLVRGALLTGCRYSELTRLTVADINLDAGVITIRESKSGKPRHVVLTEEGQLLFSQLIAGKFGSELVFTRSDGGVWGKSHQLRPMLEACNRAKIDPPISFHILRHTHGSALAMRGVPFGVIAQQLGHADTRMTEKHYAHLAPSYVADTIRAHFPKLGIAGGTKVISIPRPATAS